METPSREVFSKYTTAETFAKIKEYDSVAEMWANCLAEYADTPAIEDDGNTYTFAQLESMAASMRAVIAQTAAGQPIRVGILSQNSAEFAAAFIAVTTLGCTAAILPPQLDDKTIYGCGMKFSLKLLLCQTALSEKAKLFSSLAPAVDMTQAAAGAEKLPAVEVSGEAGCAIMFTGGTTGRSKGALLSNRAVMQGVVNGCYGYRDVFGQRYMLVLPLSHVFGLIRNLLSSLYTGSTLFICKNNKDMFRDIAAFRPTILVLVPALAEMALTLSKKFRRNMLGDSMKYIICGAAAVAPYLVSEYAAMGITLFPGYGLTESANLVSGNPESAAKPESVGIMYPHQEYRIVDGELWLKGANMMDAYIGEENETAWEDGWFKTGDLVRLDEEGFLYITGRIKEIIVLSNGENISPAELEARFNALPCIQDSQVFEDVTADGRHILALEVVPRATELAGIEDSGAYVMQQLQQVNIALQPYERVSRIEIRTSDFARTPSMKIVRYKKCQ